MSTTTTIPNASDYADGTTRRRDGIGATAWLQAVIDLAMPDILAVTAEVLDIAPDAMPDVRVRVARSHGIGRGMATSRKSGGCIGQTVHPYCSGDGHIEMTVSPVMGGDTTASTAEVVQVGLHEGVHAALYAVSISVEEWVGHQFGHGPHFAAIANAIGCEGKPTATVHGADLLAWTHATIIPLLGPYPAPPLDLGAPMPGGTVNPGPARPDAPAGPSHGPTGRRKQGTRMVAVRCVTDGCDAKGYTARTTRKWLAYGAPSCPCCSREMQQD